MAIETGLRTLLINEASITTLVASQSVRGSTCPGVFVEHPVRGFQLPYILIHQVGIDPMVCLDGTTGMESYEIDIDCYAVEAHDAIAIGNAVSDYLKDYTGAAGADDTINAVIWQGKRMDVIQEGEGRDVQYHIVSLSFQIQAS